jgi:ABC-2 type transport system permease protein
MMYRDFLILGKSKFRLVELLYFPLTSIIIWGMFAIFTRDFSAETGLMVLAVNVFWSFTHLAQFSTNIQINQDFWSGSFRQVMCSGFSEFEYIMARIFSSSIAAAGIMVIMLLSAAAFGLTVFLEQPLFTVALTGISLLGSVSLAIIVAALIIILGREYAFLAWTVLQGFVLLSAPLYPVDILPPVLQYVAFVMPFTNIFAGVRSLIGTGAIPSGMLVNGLWIVMVYLIISIPLYWYAFRRAKRNGTLARMH